jgi:hypothetical protein
LRVLQKEQDSHPFCQPKPRHFQRFFTVFTARACTGRASSPFAASCMSMARCVTGQSQQLFPDNIFYCAARGHRHIN